MKKIKLYPHQQEGLRRALKEPFFSLFMEMGTGKTAVAIKAMEERYKKGEIRRVIIFVPNSITLNWIIEIGKFISLPKGSYVLDRMNHKKKNHRTEAFHNLRSQDPELCTLKELKGQGAVGRKKDIVNSQDKKLIILVANYDKARVMFKELKKFKPHMTICDESHKLKGVTTAVSKKVYAISRSSDYRLMMTGTPICNGVQDLFMPYKIMDEDIFGSEFPGFRNRYLKMGGYMGKQIVGHTRESEIQRILSETSYRIRLDDCVELPPLVMKYHNIELGSKATSYYNEMKENMLVEVENVADQYPRAYIKEVLKSNGVYFSPKESYASLILKAQVFINTSSCELMLTQIIKLQQITGGFITTDDGNIHRIDHGKASEVKNIILDHDRPIIVFCKYVAEIDGLMEDLKGLSRNKQLLNIQSYRDKKNRDKIYTDFQKGKIDVLILQIRTGSVGLNLQVSNKAIFYSWNHSADDYIQAIFRIKRQNQKNPMEVIHLIAEDTIDMEILDIVKTKRLVANRVLDGRLQD